MRVKSVAGVVVFFVTTFAAASAEAAAEFRPALMRLASSGRTLYTMFKPEELMRQCSSEKLGVRVEDTILITEAGCENLTAGIPREVRDIEALMKQPGIPQILGKAPVAR